MPNSKDTRYHPWGYNSSHPLPCRLLDQCHQVVHDAIEVEILGRVDGGDAELFQHVDIVIGDDAAGHHRHVTQPRGAQALHHLADQRHVGAGENRQAENVDIVFSHRLHQLFRRHADAVIDHLQAHVGGAHGDLFGAVGMAIETPRFLMGKPGLDGHSNGAEQIAVRAADVGLEVIYDGIRVTPEQLVKTVAEKRVHILGLSILSGSHVPLIREVMQRLRAAGLGHVPVVAGGIIPADDVNVLKQLGVAAVYTSKDFDLNRIMDDLVGLIEKTVDEKVA